MFKKEKSAATTTDCITKNLNLRTQIKSQNDFKSNGYFPQAKKSGLSPQTKHAIYDRLISLLEGEIKPPFVLHSLTRHALRTADAMTEIELDALETKISKDFPVRRRTSTIPVELFTALRRRRPSETGSLSRSKLDDFNSVFDRRVVRIPDADLNLAICQRLEKEFSRDELLKVSGFVIDDNFLMLDIGDHLVKRGFLMPVLDSGGLIGKLRIFRRTDDPFPFTLTSRGGFKYDAN